MEGEVRIGVYICHCGSNIAGTVDVGAVADFVRGLPSVVVARDYKYMCSDPGQTLIRDDIKELGLNRVVVSSCSPLMHERTFRQNCERAGVNRYLFQMANIREHCSWITEDCEAATEKAKALVSAAVRRVYYQESLEIKTVPVNPNTLVVGGGIAGIQAALEIADGKHTVYLVERDPSIGGHMIQLDKTFPTLDCSACIMTPKMSLVGFHPYIELMAYSEVEEVSGYVGNFKVKIRKKSRYVDVSKCTGCAECVKVCPVEVPSEFELGMSQRQAIYRPFPQAVPSVFTIDKRGQSPCRVACPASVNAQGYTALISKGKFKEALDIVRKTLPFPAICGSVCHHPCEDECHRKEIDEPVSTRLLHKFIADWARENGEEPPEAIPPTRKEKVVIVGAGPSGLTCAQRLVEKGYPVTILEASDKAGGMIASCIPDYRNKKEIANYEIGRVLAHGMELKTNTRVGKDITLDQLRKKYKAIYVGIGAQDPAKLPVEGAEAKGVLYGLPFLRDVKSGQKVKDFGQKVIIIGGGNVAIDCAKSAIRVGAKSVHVVCLETRDMTSKDKMPAHLWEIEEAEEEGVVIHGSLGPKKILSQNGQTTGLETQVCTSVYEDDGRFSPKFSGEAGPTIEADTVIIAIGQRPDFAGFEDLEKTPRKTIKVDEITLETSIPGVFAGGDIVKGPASVIEAVAHGNEAAESIDRFLNGADLKEGRGKKIEPAPLREKEVEKKARAKIQKRDPQSRVKGFEEIELGFAEEGEKTVIEEATRCLNCAVCSECLECVKACELKVINQEMEDEIVEVDVGNIILATGYDAFDPSPLYQYGYGRLDNVVTGLEFERMVSASGPTQGHILLKDGNEPQSVAIIHCVGSRDKNYHKYCSRVCCMYGLKYSHLIKEHTKAEVYQMYMDMRCFGKGYEEFYERLSEEGVYFIRAKVGEVTNRAVTDEEKGKLVVVSEDTLLGSIIRVPVDMVILCTALEARSDADKVARLFSLSRSPDGFFLERHPKLDPVATMTDGTFVVGCCQGPKDIPDTVAQASAAAGRVLAMISAGTIEIEAATAVIDEKLCSGCLICNLLCPYKAITFDKEKKVSQINEALCKGCGVCVAACPTEAITGKHFTTEQIMAEIEGVLV